MALEILQTGSNPRDSDWVAHWVEASRTHLFWKSVEQVHLTCLGAGIWEQQTSRFMAQHGSVTELHFREWAQPSQCSKIQTKRTHPRASREKLKAPGKSLGPGQWTSILTSTHSSPSTPASLIHRELRGPERAHFTLIFEFLPTWLILISPALLPEEEEGGLAEQKETEQPSVRGHAWPQGHWKEVSLRE